MFKKKKSIHLSYVRQGLIYFTCATYHIQPQRVKTAIENLCVEVAGEDYKALFCLLTSGRTTEDVADKSYINDKLLSKWRADFYHEWNRRYLGR